MTLHLIVRLDRRLGFLSPDDGGTEGGVKTIERSQESFERERTIASPKGGE
jgi:hypothetical protein